MILDILDREELVSDLLVLRRRGGLRPEARLDATPVLAIVLEQLTSTSLVLNRLSPVERARSTLMTFIDRMDQPVASCVALALNLPGDLRGIVHRRQLAGDQLGKSPRQLQRLEDQGLQLLATLLIEGLTANRRSRLLGAAAAGSQRRVAVLAPLTWWPTDYYTELCRAIRQAADRERAEVRRDVMILDIPRDLGARGGEILSDTLLEDVCGLISVNLTLPERLLNRCADARIPVVSVTHHEPHPACSASILPDHDGFAELVRATLERPDVGAAVLLTKELLNPLKREPIDPFRQEKRKIFLDGGERRLLVGSGEPLALDPMAPTRIAESSMHVVEVNHYSLEEGRRAYLAPRTPTETTTAVIALADVMAAGFLAELRITHKSLRAAGIRLTGFDNSPFAELHDISSIDYNLRRVGRVAYDRIQEAIDHPGLTQSIERISCTYVPRASSTW